MNTIGSNTADYIGFTQKLIKRNTAIKVINAKQAGEPIDKQAIQQSNQEIKDKSIDAGLAIYQNSIKRKTLDTYIQTSNNADYSNTTDQQDSNEINSFDTSAVNEARAAAQKRAIGISIHERIQAIE